MTKSRPFFRFQGLRKIAPGRLGLALFCAPALLVFKEARRATKLRLAEVAGNLATQASKQRCLQRKAKATFQNRDERGRFKTWIRSTRTTQAIAAYGTERPIVAID